jgi:hypothetical protein
MLEHLPELDLHIALSFTLSISTLLLLQILNIFIRSMVAEKNLLK